jgi:hypothetical protein
VTTCKPHGNTGKQNALKPDELKAESFIHARCKRSDKAKWVIASRAEGLKLTEWIVKNLNKSVGDK